MGNDSESAPEALDGGTQGKAKTPWYKTWGLICAVTAVVTWGVLTLLGGDRSVVMINDAEFAGLGHKIRAATGLDGMLRKEENGGNVGMVFGNIQGPDGFPRVSIDDERNLALHLIANVVPKVVAPGRAGRHCFLVVGFENKSGLVMGSRAEYERLKTTPHVEAITNVFLKDGYSAVKTVEQIEGVYLLSVYFHK